MKIPFLKNITRKQFAWGALAVFVLMQLIRIDKTNPAIEQEKDFMQIVQPSQDISMMLKESCYDCHSHHTKYPWYTDIAPLSWWIKGHIKEGRKHLNFSTWGDYTDKRKDHKLEECVEKVENKSMPLTSYVLGHSEAKLTDEDRKKLETWFASLRN